MKSLSRVQLFAIPWTVAYQAPRSMGFSRQEYWLPFPSPGDLPDPGIEPGSPTLQADALPSEPPGKLEVGCKPMKGIKDESQNLRVHWINAVSYVSCKRPFWEQMKGWVFSLEHIEFQTHVRYMSGDAQESTEDPEYISLIDDIILSTANIYWVLSIHASSLYQVL